MKTIHTPDRAVVQQQYSAYVTGVSSASDVVSIGSQPVNEYARIDSISAPAVPEPETWALMLAGMGLLAAVARRQRRA